VLDDLPVGDVKRFESELLDYFRGPHADILAQIGTTGAVPDGDTLATAVADFRSRFVVTGSEAGAA
jgi:F-type H+/Na+-transporting ATPase subunit alpha